jgi:general secretion pathway protein K
MKRQRGVALITAVLIVALATILAVRVGTRGALDQRRAGTLLALEQAYQVGLGAEAWAGEILREDRERSREDNLSEVWATPLPPLPIDGGSVAGGLEDMQGRFNLNNLVQPDGKPDAVMVEIFQRLLEHLNLEPKWATLLVDWLDPDTLPGFPEGAEDGVYNGLTPPYRAANGPITSTSELLALPEFGRERYERLAPYVAALPYGTKLNVCTAAGVVIDSLADNTSEFSADPKLLQSNREKGCFPTVNDVQSAIGDAAFQKVRTKIDNQSSWFRATTLVTIGTTQFTLYSLLERNPGGLVRPVLRTFGTE